MSGDLLPKDQLYAWLKGRDFYITIDHFKSQTNTYNWKAYRTFAKPEGTLQLIIKPEKLDGEPMTVNVCVLGELHREWFRVSVESLRPEMLYSRISRLEEDLYTAWRTLA